MKITTKVLLTIEDESGKNELVIPASQPTLSKGICEDESGSGNMRLYCKLDKKLYEILRQECVELC